MGEGDGSVGGDGSLGREMGVWEGGRRECGDGDGSVGGRWEPGEGDGSMGRRKKKVCGG